MSTMVTTGRALWADDQSPMTGGKDEIWDHDRVGADELLGVAVIGAGGFYTIRHAKLRDVYARVYDRTGVCRYISKVYPRYRHGFLALNFRVARGRLATDGIAGRVLWRGGQPAVPCLVELFRAGTTRDVAVAAAVVNEHGWYAIPAAQSGRYYIRVTDPAGDVCRYLSPHVSKGDEVCRTLNASVDPSFEVFRVVGRVTVTEPGGSARAAANAAVSAYDWDRFSASDRLGSARTDDQGRYAISFRPRDFNDERYENPNRPDLFVRVAVSGDRELHRTTEVLTDATMPRVVDVGFELSRVEGRVTRYAVCDPGLGEVADRPRDRLRARLRRSAGLVGWRLLGEAAVDADGRFQIEWEGTYEGDQDQTHELRFYEGDDFRKVVPLEVSVGPHAYRQDVEIEVPCAQDSTRTPDLVAALDLDPDIPMFDDVDFVVRGAVTNFGGEASGSFTAELQFINETAGAASVTTLRTLSCPGLAPGEALAVEHAQSALPAGNYRFCLVADRDAEVEERSESNNVACSGLVIHARRPTPP